MDGSPNGMRPGVPDPKQRELLDQPLSSFNSPRLFAADEMTEAKQDEQPRIDFYGNKVVAKFVMAEGIPRTTGAFKRMVASGSTEKLDNKKGIALIACLGNVMFTKHPQQITVMDKVTGKTIATFA